jgi:hypothetical protein
MWSEFFFLKQRTVGDLPASYVGDKMLTGPDSVVLLVMMFPKIGTMPALLSTCGGSVGDGRTLSVRVTVGGRGAEVRAVLLVGASLARCALKLGSAAMVMSSGCAAAPVL